MACLSRVVVMVCLLITLPVSAGAKPTVWSLESSRGNIVLLGSIHVGDSSFYPFDTRVERAFENASALVVELDVSALDVNEIGLLTRKLGMFNAQQLRDGVNLTSVLSVEAQSELSAFCQGDNKNVCPPSAQMALMQPWLLALHFATAMLSTSGYETRYGVDSYFLNRAANKPIIELESFASQMKAFSGLDSEAQTTFLRQTLAEFHASHGAVAEMVDAWRTGNDAQLQTLVLDPMIAVPEGQAIYEALFQRRNRAMTQGLLTHVKQGHTLFVVVGAGHLLGDEGLISLLKAEGFKVSKF